MLWCIRIAKYGCDVFISVIGHQGIYQPEWRMGRTHGYNERSQCCRMRANKAEIGEEYGQRLDSLTGLRPLYPLVGWCSFEFERFEASPFRGWRLVPCRGPRPGTGNIPFVEGGGCGGCALLHSNRSLRLSLLIIRFSPQPPSIHSLSLSYSLRSRKTHSHRTSQAT
jgi:hypothetical protein